MMFQSLMYDLELDILNLGFIWCFDLWCFDLWILSFKFQCFTLYAFSFSLDLEFELHGIHSYAI